MKRVGLLVLGSFINSLGTGLTAFGLAIIMLRTYGTASSVAAVQLSSFAITKIGRASCRERV